MLHIGDSVTEGTGAGGFEAKWTTKLLRGLQSAAGLSGGPGFVNTGSYVSSDNSLSTFYSPTAGSIGGGGFLGNRVGGFSANQAVTVSFTGTSVALYLMEHFGGAQPYTVAVDGGTPSTITVSTTGTLDNHLVWSSPVLAHGTHTVLLTPGSGVAPFLRGIYVYDGDETKGLHGWEAGHYGDKTSSQAGSPAAYFGEATPLIQPAVCTLFLGLNDWQSGVAAATYQANLATIISAVNGYCATPPSWVICGIYRRTDVASPAVPLADYTAAAQAVANADPVNRRFVDLSKVSIPLDADGVHPNPTGHAAIAAAIRPAVLDLAGASAPASNPYVVRNIT